MPDALNYSPSLYATWRDKTWPEGQPARWEDPDPDVAPVDADEPLDFSAGEAVEISFESFNKWLQSCLKRLVAPNITVDGALGPRSRAAIKDFQKRVKSFVPGAAALTVDGVAGPATIAALEAATSTRAPSATGAPAPVVRGPVTVRELRAGAFRVEAEGRAVELSFSALTREDRDGQTLEDPWNARALDPTPSLAALQAAGLTRGEAAVVAALVGPDAGFAALDGASEQLVTLGLGGLGGRSGEAAAVLAAAKEDDDARAVVERLAIASGLDVDYGGDAEQSGFFLTARDDDGAALRGDEAWAHVRSQAHLLGALALTLGDPAVAKIQARWWRGLFERTLRRRVGDGELLVESLVRSELGVAAMLALTRVRARTLRAWTADRVQELAARNAGLALDDPAIWDSTPALEQELVRLALAELPADLQARLAGLDAARGSFFAGRAAEPDPAAQPAVAEPDATASDAPRTPPAGGTYVERRVKVKTYGTLPAKSPLLVTIPAVSGTIRLHTLAAQALAKMSEAILRDLKITVKIASGWRAHRWTSREQYEQVLVQRFGSVSEGKRWLAFDSPHETGLAVDFGVGGLWPTRSTVGSQRKTPLHAWLVEHAWEYGFHPYKTEPWHWEHPLSLEAFKSGVLKPGDPGPPEDALSFGDLEDEEFALEDSDLTEEPAPIEDLEAQV